MASTTVAFRQFTGVSQAARTFAPLPQGFLALAGALAATGLAELLLQRVVYRVGLHLPRDGAVQDVYHLATLAGDFAFRLAAVLLVLATVAALIWLLSHPATYVAGLFLGVLATANVLAWSFQAAWSPVAVQFAFVFAAVWLIGRYSGRTGSELWFTFGAVAAGLSLALTYYGSGMTALAGRPEPFGVARLQWISEALLLIAALGFGHAAIRGKPRVWPLTAAAGIGVILLTAHLREPATVAITSLWAVGVTMSLPAILYISAFAAVVLAILTWLSDPGTRPLAVGATLLVIAGLEPQALHHSLTAVLGLILLYCAPPLIGGNHEMEEVLP